MRFQMQLEALSQPQQHDAQMEVLCAGLGWAGLCVLKQEDPLNECGYMYATTATAAAVTAAAEASAVVVVFKLKRLG